MILVTVEEKLEQIRQLTLRSENTAVVHSIARNLPIDQTSDFDDLIGQSIKKNAIIHCDGVQYMVMQDTTAQAHFRPSGTGLLALYQPHQDRGLNDWIYGEYGEIGDQRRIADGRIFEAIQAPNANIYSPELVPAIWKEVVSEPIDTI